MNALKCSWRLDISPTPGGDTLAVTGSAGHAAQLELAGPHEVNRLPSSSVHSCRIPGSTRGTPPVGMIGRFPPALTAERARARIGMAVSAPAGSAATARLSEASVVAQPGRRDL